MNLRSLHTLHSTINALLCNGWRSSFISLAPYRAWCSWWIWSCLTSTLSQPSSLQNKRRKQPTLWYISVFQSLWFIIQLPSNMFQLGSDFCRGLAAAAANRELNIYILLSSGKQTPFWGSAVRAVKLCYLCACWRNSYNIFMVNECKFYFDRDLAHGVKWWRNAYVKCKGTSQTICSFSIKGFEIGVVTPLVKMSTANEVSEGRMLFANSRQASRPQSRDLPLVPNLEGVHAY